MLSRDGRRRLNHSGTAHLRRSLFSLLAITSLLPLFLFTSRLQSRSSRSSPPADADAQFLPAVELPLTKLHNPNPKLERLELSLAEAREAIRRSINGSQVVITGGEEFIPRGPLYRNARAFHRSYLEMEKRLKISVYEEGEPPLFHDGPCRSIYSTEGRFIHNMEVEEHFRAIHPDEAHVHFLPFSVKKMVRYLRKGFQIRPIHRTIEDYIHLIASRYPYWNRSLGADHFMISCHDWGPNATAGDHHLLTSAIRVLCNANTSEGFDPTKDVSLPEVNLRADRAVMVKGSQRAARRPILAFFAGRLHGRIRKALVRHWKGRDEDVQVYLELPPGSSYHGLMRRSKYCLCPSGWEVASPRIVEAIYLECIPVVISSGYTLPFSDVLNWDAFSVRVSVQEIPDLKNILLAVSPRRYASMRRMVRDVKRHFVLTSPPRRFDLYHMILHSVWLRRLNIRIHG